MSRVRRRGIVLAVTLLVGLLGAALPVATPAAADRTVGDDPLDVILDAANEHKACGLSRDKLAAIMLAPTFRESGAPPDEAPSPMTLSRWDTQAALYALGALTAGAPLWSAMSRERSVTSSGPGTFSGLWRAAGSAAAVSIGASPTPSACIAAPTSP